MRRIVTGNVDGRSRVIQDDMTPVNIFEEVWGATPEQPLGAERPVDAPVVPVPSGSVFRVVTLPPHREIVKMMTAQAQAGGGTDVDLDADGFHLTPTLDYNLVLDGPVDLLLDDERVTVQPGEVVVQRQTNHAWHNLGDAPIRLVNVMISLPEGYEGE